MNELPEMVKFTAIYNLVEEIFMENKKLGCLLSRYGYIFKPFLDNPSCIDLLKEPAFLNESAGKRNPPLTLKQYERFFEEEDEEEAASYIYPIEMEEKMRTALLWMLKSLIQNELSIIPCQDQNIYGERFWVKGNENDSGEMVRIISFESNGKKYIALPDGEKPGPTYFFADLFQVNSSYISE